MNLTVIIIIAFVSLWFVGIFFGFITGVPKSFQNNPSKNIDSSKLKSQAQERIEATELSRQKMMEDIKQKISDSQQKH